MNLAIIGLWIIRHSLSISKQATHACQQKTIRCSKKKPEEPKDDNSNGRLSPETGGVQKI